jgi:hypothetical protein
MIELIRQNMLTSPHFNKREKSMATKIIVLATDGESREDASVYYSRYLLVSSDTLLFNEPVFSDSTITTQDIDGIACDEDDNAVDDDKLIEHIRSLGYTVEEPASAIITTA